jgi:hypothetical protein
MTPMTLWSAVGAFVLNALGGTRLPTAWQPPPVACAPAAANDPAPWVGNAALLKQFPPEVPRPQFLGAFGDRNQQYEIHLWQDRGGVFGEALHPVLEADSPVSRLYDARFDSRTGALSFATRFPSDPWTFTGTLGSAISGTVFRGDLLILVMLRPLTASERHGIADEDTYVSRAQFDCAMVLFRRF